MKAARSFALLAVTCLAGVAMAGAYAQDSDIPNRAEPIEGITTAGQPSAKALSELADQGYTTVIDLRGKEEDRGFDEAATVEGLGMKYIQLPISGADDISYDNANALDQILQDLHGPALLHCSSSNRVGALLTLRAKLHGEDDDSALALGEEAGLTRLKPAVEEVLSKSPPPESEQSQ
jgi:uncharacterized protein (TIGR01244 family)